MKKIIIIIIAVVMLFALKGCDADNTEAFVTESTSEVHKPISTLNQMTPTPEIKITHEIKQTDDSTATPRVTAAPTEETGEITEEINGELRVIIDVYVNDELMAESVYKNENSANVVGPDNLSDYILAQPIAEFLNIECIIDEENNKLIMKSDKYDTHERPLNSYAKYINEELYIEFSLFRYFTGGSLIQDGYEKMYLYTPDYERTDLPTTLEECYTILDAVLSEEDIEFIKNSTESDRIGMHLGLCMWMRNIWLNQVGFKLTDDFYEAGFWHIDDMSSAILEGYYRYLNDEPSSFDDMVEWYLDKYSS